MDSHGPGGLRPEGASFAQMVTLHGLFLLPLLFQRPGQRKQIFLLRDILRVAELHAQHVKQLRQTDDILPVVIQNPDQRCKVPILQILKVGLGHQCAGKIVFPLHAQQRRFQRAQIALLQPQLPQAAGGEQHVRMTGGDAVVPNAMHEKTGLEQRHVEGFPVEGTKHGKTLHPGGQQVEHGFFIRVVPHEKLLHRKTCRGKISKPHLKGHRAYAAGKPRGFRIQKKHVLRRNGSRKFAAEHGAQRFRRGIASVAEGGQREHGFPTV